MNTKNNQNDSPIKGEMYDAWYKLLEYQALIAKNAEEASELAEQQARAASVLGDAMRAFTGHVTRMD